MPFIYVIYNLCNNKIYVGSTQSKYVSLRLAQHRYYYNKMKRGEKYLRYSSVKVFEDDDGEYECYSDFVAEVDKEEMKEIESFYIHYFKECGFEVVNENDAIYDLQKYAQKRKEKYEKNPDFYREKSSIYYWKNREKILHKMKIKRMNDCLLQMD